MTLARHHNRDSWLTIEEEQMKRDVNSLTGGFGSCSMFPIVEKKDSPKFGHEEIFERVFGKMEQLRIVESLRCKKARERMWSHKGRVRRRISNFRWFWEMSEGKPIDEKWWYVHG